MSLSDADVPLAHHQALLDSLRERHSELELLLVQVEAVGGDGEDLVYRFWHQSLKVFALQELTLKVVATFRSFTSAGELHPLFEAMVVDGTGRTFSLADNDRWLEVVGPIVAAYLHALHLLRLAVCCAGEMEVAPVWLPSGWATLLEVFNLR
jgi:hypothetical protein